MTAPETGKRGKGRATVSIRGSLEYRLLAYAAAASASVVAAQPVAAKVIYMPMNLTIEPGTVPLDLNHDGVVDFNLVERHYPYVNRMRGPSCCFHGSQTLNVNGAGNPGAGVMGTAYSPFDAGALVLGAEIGPGLHFDRVQNANALMAQVGFFTSRESKLYSFCDGPFAGFAACTGTTDRFLGLRFQVSGDTYYGWAGFSVVKVGIVYIRARLVGVAYEDVPGQPIRAGQLQDGTAMMERTPSPQPATLGLLALGAPGLDIWRPRNHELTAA